MMPLKLACLFFLFLVMSSGQTILLVDRAEARICNPYRLEPPPPCTQGYYLVYGSVKKIDQKKGNTFRIRVDNEILDIKANQDVAHIFKNKKMQEKEVSGFGILTKKGKHIELIAFIPNSPNTEDTTQPLDSVGAVIEQYNKEFKKFAQKKDQSSQTYKK